MNEYLSPDILEDEFVKNFSLLLFLQKILGSSRVDLRHNFVLPPTVWQKLFSVTWLISMSYFCQMSFIVLNKIVDYSGIYYAAAISEAVQAVAVSNILHARFFNGEDNAKFYIKLQNIDRLLKIERNDIISHILYTISIVFVAIIVIGNLLGMYVMISNSYMELLYAGYTQICLFIDIYHCCHIIFYFYVRLRFINAIIINYIEDNPIRLNPGKGILPTKNRMLYLASISHNFASSETDVYLNELLDVFANLVELYQFQLFLCCAKFIPLCLCGFIALFALQSPQNRNMPQAFRAYIKMCAYILVAYDFCVILIIPLVLGIFLNEILNTKRLCTKVMFLNNEGPLRKKASNMLKRIKQKPPVFLVYNIWAMEPYTIINVVKIFTTVAITVLQFMYL